MSEYYDQIIAALRATTFHSPVSYSWFGEMSPPFPGRLRRAFTLQDSRDCLLFILQNQLYRDFYCLGFAAPSRDEALDVQQVHTTTFVRELAAANQGKGDSEDYGCKVQRLQDDRIVVQRDGLQLYVRRNECLNPARFLKRGQRLNLRFPRELLGNSPGFYIALSDKAWSPRTTRRTIRIYWNLTAECAPRFLRVVTSTLNAANLPFRVKVPNHPRGFNRCDAGVLYLPTESFGRTDRLLEKVFIEVAPYLRGGTPALTKTLAPGLAWAEGPEDADSFGMHRCNLLADGMLRANEQGKKSLRERLQIVESLFEEQGISLKTPYLNPSSRYRRSFDPLITRLIHLSRDRIGVTQPSSDAKSFLMTAHEIGQQIWREAFWHKDLCNWLGAAPLPFESETAPQRLAYRTMGGDLYSGTSGVALFLAELYAASGDAEACRTALGAIRHSLSQVAAVPPGSRLGLYTGWTGIALATLRVGMALGREELLELAAQLLRRMTHEVRRIDEFDFLSGKAGAIAGLLALRKLIYKQALLELAARLGDKLLQEAQKSDRGYSWKSTSTRAYRNLTGFSQGAAGVAYALLELYQETGDSRYRMAAEYALKYERGCFDVQARNWPDYRSRRWRVHRSKGIRSFENSWSHGAAGIALSRLRAFQILRDELYKAEAISALQTTRQALDDWRRVGLGNYSLAQGIAGNAEVLLNAHEVLEGDLENERSLALQIAREGCMSDVTGRRCWFCGTATGFTPSLMHGLAGIGYFYLRLRNPRIPSALTWQAALDS